jgi:hypothetical protein
VPWEDWPHQTNYRTPNRTTTHLFAINYGWPGSIRAPDDGQGTPETCRVVLYKITNKWHQVGHLYVLVLFFWVKLHEMFVYAYMYIYIYIYIYIYVCVCVCVCVCVFVFVVLSYASVFPLGSRLQCCVLTGAANYQQKLPADPQHTVSVHTFVLQLSCCCKEMREHMHNYPCFFRQTCFKLPYPRTC